MMLGWGPGQSHQVLWLCPALNEGNSQGPGSWLTKTYFQHSPGMSGAICPPTPQEMISPSPKLPAWLKSYTFTHPQGFPG